MTTDKALGAMATVGNALTTSVAASGGRQQLVARLSLAIGWLFTVWLLLAGSLLAWRTATTAVRPLTLGPLVLSAVTLAAAASVTRAARMRSLPGKEKSVPETLVPLLLITAGVAIWTVAVCSHSSSLLGLLLFVSIVLSEELWAWRRALRNVRVPRRARTFGRVATPFIVQQLTRVLSADGREAIEGSVTIRVDPGSKSAAAHVGFCPPFASQPAFELRSTTEKGVVLKIGQLLPQGARIEAKLPAPAEAARIISVQFVARTRSDTDGPMAV